MQRVFYMEFSETVLVNCAIGWLTRNQWEMIRDIATHYLDIIDRAKERERKDNVLLRRFGPLSGGD